MSSFTEKLSAETELFLSSFPEVFLPHVQNDFAGVRRETATYVAHLNDGMKLVSDNPLIPGRNKKVTHT